MSQNLFIKSISTLILGLSLTACGGGGASGGGTSQTVTSLSGTAAVGFAVVNGTVNVKCASSTAIASSTTSAAGAIQVNLTGQTLPCALQVTGGTINGIANTNNYHSIAISAGNVNVTPLTDLLIANLAGTATPTAWFAGLTTAQLAAITVGQVTTAATNVKTALGLTTQLAGIDLITTAFTPTRNNVMDNTLEALQAAITNNATPYTTLLTNAGASANAGFTTPAGFNAALTAAYVPPGGATTPTPTVTGFSPNTGAVGTVVTITGTNLGLGFQPAPIVKFGTTAVTTPLTFNGQTSISFAVPTGLAAGAHTITIGGMTGVPLKVGTFTVTATPVAPAAPASVIATAVGSTEISLSWQTVSGATSYNVYRSTTSPVSITPANKLSIAPIQLVVFTYVYNDLLLAANTPYYYAVTTVTGAGESLGSAEVTATTLNVPVPVVAVGTQMGGSRQAAALNLTTQVSVLAGQAVGASPANSLGARDSSNPTLAGFNSPTGITTDGVNLYVADKTNCKIRKLEIATGVVTTVAGGGLINGLFSAGNVDGPGAIALFNSPMGITTDGTNLYVVDTFNNTIRKIVTATGVVSTFAGGGTFVAGGGNGPALTASFNGPQGITTDGVNLYVADRLNHNIRQIVIATGVVSTLAGTGALGAIDGPGITTATFNYPSALTTDGVNLYVADTFNHKIRKIVIATGVVSTLAGTGVAGAVEGAGLTTATFNYPSGITTDGVNLYVSDLMNNKIRKVIIATGMVSTLAGSGTAASGANYTPVINGLNATFNNPAGITSDGVSLFVADTGLHIIRKIQ